MRGVPVAEAESAGAVAIAAGQDSDAAWAAEVRRLAAEQSTTAAVKAESDVCCTSSNAVEVVESIPADRESLFLPDQFLGAHVQRVTGRDNIRIWMGECHVHAGISGQQLRDKVAARPEAEVFVHPECGCATSALWMAGLGDLPSERTHILSTGGMLDRARQTTAGTVLVATEIGMLNQLRQANPTTAFEPVNPRAECHFMKMITPAALLRSLREGTYPVEVDPAIAARARRAVEAMLEFGVPSTTGE
jgi:quinolinate synthase